MGIVTKILLAISAITFLGIAAIAISFWPVDPRLSGTFKSDKEETIKYLKSIKKLTEKQVNNYAQIYGHFYYVFDGHKVKTISEPYTIHSVFSDGSDLNMGASENESYFVMKKTSKENDEFILFVIPSPWSELESIGKIEIRFAEDGFWILNSFFGSPYYKEKLTRINR